MQLCKMCELILQRWNDFPQYSKDFVLKCFAIGSDELSMVSRKRTTFCVKNSEYIFFTQHYSSEIRKSFCDKKLLAANFITIWPLVRALIILTEKQCTWRGTNLMQQILSLSHICQMLLILVQCVWLICSIKQFVWANWQVSWSSCCSCFILPWEIFWLEGNHLSNYLIIVLNMDLLFPDYYFANERKFYNTPLWSDSPIGQTPPRPNVTAALYWDAFLFISVGVCVGVRQC